LPSYEYIPDAEPKVFGDRVYIYGSHDRFGAPFFCLNDYVCYSCPKDDLGNWRLEGIIYRKKQDPRNHLGLHLLFAPDLVQGKDGRFYLYYGLDFSGLLSVAVCDTPAGNYEFLGHVRHPDGTLLGRKAKDPFGFDPSVLIDNDGRIFLYSGFAEKIPRILTGLQKLKTDGGYVMELADDMISLKSEAKLLFPATGKDAFKGHEFYEASSIRRYKNTYYFVYSSRHNHELCYASSQFPDKDYTFQGTLISIGDLGIDGNTDEKTASNYLGNTHGGLLQLEERWFIFYHCQTNRHSYSRQACAEELRLNSEGQFLQAELTSCGLNQGALKASGTYEARIACNLWSQKGTQRYDSFLAKWRLARHPYFTQSGKDRETHADQYLANLRHNSVAGFKYFIFEKNQSLRLYLRGRAFGKLQVSQSPGFEKLAGEAKLKLRSKKDWQFLEIPCSFEPGTKALYFRYKGRGFVDFSGFSFNG